MNTEHAINLSQKFNVCNRARLLGSFDTIEEARRFLTQCPSTATIVYPRRAIATEVSNHAR